MRFDLCALDGRDGATFRGRDAERQESTDVVIPTSKWHRMGRPVTIVGEFSAPAAGWFVELNAVEDPTIWDGDEPVLSRSDVPAHWDELVARLGIAP